MSKRNGEISESEAIHAVEFLALGLGIASLVIYLITTI
jgi:hypothetical protein